MWSAPQPGTRFSSLFLWLLLSMFVTTTTVRAVPAIPSDFQLRFSQLGNQGALGSYALRRGATSMPMRYGPPLVANEYVTETCVFTCLALGYRYAGLHQANNNCGCDDDLGYATQYGRAPSGAFGFALYDTAPLTGWYPLMGYFSISNVSQKFRFSPEDRGFSLHTCNAACIAAGYKYFALQDWQSQDLSQCWCDSSLPDPADRVSITMTALEATPQRISTYYLGAPDQLAVYETCFGCLPTVATAGGALQDPTVSVAPAVPQDVLSFKSIGPYRKSFSVVVESFGWSPAACNQYCVGQGFSHFGLGDYLPSRQSRCYCGSDLSTMTKSGPAYCGVRQPAWQWYGSADCNFVYETCNTCASSATNAMLRPADTVPYTFLGTFSDRADRALRYGPQNYGYTVDSCNDMCSSLGYSYFALQDYSPTMLSWCSCDNDVNHAKQYGVPLGGSCAATSTALTTPVWNYLRPYYGGDGCNALYSTKPLIQKAIGAGSLTPWYTASNSRSFVGTSVPETQRYRSVGQFIDRLPRALPYGPHAYGYNAHSCNAACLTQGYSYFALQAYHYWDPVTSAGQSWCSCTNDVSSARKYGPATASTVKILNFGAWQALGGWGWNSIYETCSKENCSSPPTATPIGRSKFPAVLAGAGGDFGALGYGTRGWKLGGYLHYPSRVQLRSGDSVAVASWTGNAWTPWLDPSDSRLLIPPAPGGERRGDGWFTNDPMEITVTGAPSAASTEPQCLKVTFYLLDFDSTARRLSIERSYDGQPYELLYTTANDFYNGQYVSVLQPAGKTSKYRLRRVAGANIVCSGVLLDDCAASKSADVQASKSTRSTGLIIGIVAGVVGISLLTAVVAFISFRSRRSAQSEERSVVQMPTQLRNAPHAEPAPAVNTAAATAVVAGEVDMTQIAEGRPVVGIPLGYPYPADVEPVAEYDRGDPNFCYVSRAPQLLPGVATIRAAPTPALLLELLSRHYPVHPAIEKAFLKEAVDGYVFMECDWPLQIRSLPIDLRPPELQIQKWERFRVQLLQARGGAA